MNTMEHNPVFSVKDLTVKYKSANTVVHAVNGVSFQLEAGQTLGLVGETGAGKTTIAKAILRILPDYAVESVEGEILFEGSDILTMSDSELRDLRGRRIAMIFQDPYSSLDPRQTVQDIISEPLYLAGYKKDAVEARVRELVETVGIEKRLRLSYPHELDGGRRQRVGIARALALNPEFIVCDEPVSSLDVSIQAQILNLLMDLQDELGLTYLFITHDMSVVRHISNRICVMYLGQMVEMCDKQELFDHPLHPYTKALLSAIPTTNIHVEKNRILLKGEIKSPINPGPGCRFASRCLYANEPCSQCMALQEARPGHFVACARVAELNQLD